MIQRVKGLRIITKILLTADVLVIAGSSATNALYQPKHSEAPEHTINTTINPIDPKEDKTAEKAPEKPVQAVVTQAPPEQTEESKPEPKKEKPEPEIPGVVLLQKLKVS